MMEENILLQGDMSAEVCLCTNINLETRKQDALILNTEKEGLAFCHLQTENKNLKQIIYTEDYFQYQHRRQY